MARTTVSAARYGGTVRYASDCMYSSIDDCIEVCIEVLTVLTVLTSLDWLPRGVSTRDKAESGLTESAHTEGDEHEFTRLYFNMQGGAGGASTGHPSWWQYGNTSCTLVFVPRATSHTTIPTNTVCTGTVPGNQHTLPPSQLPRGLRHELHPSRLNSRLPPKEPGSNPPAAQYQYVLCTVYQYQYWTP